MFQNDIGIDLGTANILVYKKGKGIILREPSVVAIDKVSGRVLKIGNEAKEMIGRTPGSIMAIRPLKDGVIADYEKTAQMIKELIKKAGGSGFLNRTRVMISIPSGVTAVEKRAVEQAADDAGAKYVRTIEEPLAAAIGAGLPIAEPVGSMVVDIGGGTTEVAIISLAGIVTSCSVRTAGDKLDEAIITYVKKHFNVLIGERTAEDVKIKIGSAYPMEEELEMEIRGRDLINGLPGNITVNSVQIREALDDAVQNIVDAVKNTLEKSPPELASDIIDKGIMLTGGGALLRGLDKRISKETGIEVKIAEKPLDCVAEGTGLALSHLDVINSASESDR